MTMRYLGLAGALFAFGGGAVADAKAADVDSVESLAEHFCTAVLASDESAAEALMTDALRSRVAKAREADRAFQQAHPGDKPPLGDGLPLSAYPHAPSQCRASGTSAGSIFVNYTFADDPKAGWKDRLIVERSAGGAVRIADIAYAPEHRDRFGETLDRIIREGASGS